MIGNSSSVQSHIGVRDTDWWKGIKAIVPVGRVVEAVYLPRDTGQFMEKYCRYVTFNLLSLVRAP